MNCPVCSAQSAIIQQNGYVTELIAVYIIMQDTATVSRSQTGPVISLIRLIPPAYFLALPISLKMIDLPHSVIII